MGTTAKIWSAINETVRGSTYDLCSAWSVDNRTMQDGDPYSLVDYPYVREIIDSTAKQNWVLKGAQVGLTEAAITLSLYIPVRWRRDVIYYFPTGLLAKRFSATRISSAIQLSPTLRSLCTHDGGELKQFGAATLYVLGAGSETNLKATSSGRLIFDELDDWTERQIYLAMERASGQKNEDKILWGFSTPKYPELGIHAQYLSSTQEHFYFKCPHCDKRVDLTWPESFVIRGEALDDPDLRLSYIQCKLCEEELPHKHKKTYLSTGAFRSTITERVDPDNRGFYIPQLYSPTVTPREIAKKYFRGQVDEDARREFYNSCLALPYLEDCHRVSDAHINACQDNYTMTDPAIIPKRASDGLYTLGIDQGGPTHHWVVVKWDFDLKRSGDPSDRATGKLVGCGRVKQDDWAWLHGLMREYQIRMAVIDYFPEPTNARAFARRFAGVYLCQYVKGVAGREVRLLEDEYGAGLVRVDRVSWLTKALGRVMSVDLRLPLDIPTEFRLHLKAPVRTLTKDTDGTYVASYAEAGATHYAHSLTYAELALKILDPSLHTSDSIRRIQ